MMQDKFMDRLKTLTTDLDSLRHGLESLHHDFGRAQELDSKTNVQRVLDVLAASDGQLMSASEIASQCMIEATAARVVLYGDSNKFEKLPVSDKGHVKWRLNNSFTTVQPQALTA